MYFFALIVENGATAGEMRMAYKPKNKIISDIFWRITANLPVKGDAFPYDVRGDFAREWQLLEKRIQENYIRKVIGRWIPDSKFEEEVKESQASLSNVKLQKEKFCTEFISHLKDWSDLSLSQKRKRVKKIFKMMDNKIQFTKADQDHEL